MPRAHVDPEARATIIGLSLTSLALAGVSLYLTACPPVWIGCLGLILALPLSLTAVVLGITGLGISWHNEGAWFELALVTLLLSLSPLVLNVIALI
ncbi:MAG: hypothetical protein HND57_06430 [Planctomycetes bacterium]|nr:hypothetical protein [Planctomycetota bacterium]